MSTLFFLCTSMRKKGFFQQWVKTVIREFGVSRMLIYYELFHLLLHLPEILFQVWCSHHSLEVPEVFPVCLWQSDKIYTTTPIRQMIHIVSILKTWTVPPYIVTENKNDGYSCAA
uniref:Uncharacterized protein n=1 Tax=Micrurus carvalhoi TaxID=3147026 RepID=A0A2H6N774_9SAUR